MDRALMCPQCNAPLAPHRFARSVVCSYCGATVQLDESSVSAEIFHKAFRVWNSPASYQFPSWLSIGESHWALHKCIANGDISDVYTGQRARWPTELAIIKLLRDPQDTAHFDNEWEVLQMLQRSDAPGSDTFLTLLPHPIIHGDIITGSYAGQRVNIFRWVSGFRHTFDEMLQVYPQGIPPRASIWIWRRILEVLSFLHNSGVAHGAILPSHLLVQENEHGVRIVGYSSAGPIGEKLRTVSQRYESFYPKSVRTLTTQLDLIMSARCIVAILGGNPETGTLPSRVPPRLARLVQQIALTAPNSSAREAAWSIREELGVIASDVFGSPQFIPIVMPS
jgi:serine/threonine protein kinase